MNEFWIFNIKQRNFLKHTYVAISVSYKFYIQAYPKLSRITRYNAVLDTGDGFEW